MTLAADYSFTELDGSVLWDRSGNGRRWGQRA